MFLTLSTVFFITYKMDNLRHQKCKNKPLNNTRVLKVNNSTLELERDFKPINISINDMGKFGKKKENIYKKLLLSLVRLVN